DGGTSERMRGELLGFLGDEQLRGEIILIGASNFPGALDPAMVDRLGMVIPFLAPSPQDVAELIPAIARQLHFPLAPDVRPEAIAELPSLRQPTGRMLAQILTTAAGWANDDADTAHEPITQQHLE